MASIDPGQLGGWFDAYGPRLVLYARQWLDAALAEDVVQEVFLRLMAQAAPPANIQAWLFRCVRNGAISQLRRQMRRKHYTQILASDRRNWFEGRPDDLIDAGNAQQVLLELPVEQREIVVLRIWGQMTLREIAEIVEKPVSTVHNSYQTALQSLRTKMKSVPDQT